MGNACEPLRRGFATRTQTGGVLAYVGPVRITLDLYVPVDFALWTLGRESIASPAECNEYAANRQCSSAQIPPDTLFEISPFDHPSCTLVHCSIASNT